LSSKLIEKQTHGILLISNLFSVGASYGGVCKELAARLTEQGWNTLTTSSAANRYIRPADMLSTIFTNAKHYDIAQIDVFSGAAFRWAETSLWALKRLGKPVILTLHGGNLPQFGQQHPRRLQALLTAADEVVTPSRYLLEKLRKYHPSIRLIANPIHIGNYPYRLRTQPSANILYLRALHKMYNPTLAIHSLKKLRETHPEATLKLIGPDKGDGAAEEVQIAIEETGLAGSVDVVGAIPKAEVPQRMTQGEIFINTTNVDNTPISVIEAMACGLCVVSTNVGGIPYLLTHEHDALLVPPNDADAMAAAIRRILTEPGLAQHLSQNARATTEKFAWSHILPQWEKLLLETIERKANV